MPLLTGGMLLSTGLLVFGADPAPAGDNKGLRESPVVKMPAKAPSVAGTNSTAVTNRISGKPRVRPVFHEMPEIPRERAATNSYQAPKGDRKKAAP